MLHKTPLLQLTSNNAYFKNKILAYSLLNILTISVGCRCILKSFSMLFYQSLWFHDLSKLNVPGILAWEPTNIKISMSILLNCLSLQNTVAACRPPTGTGACGAPDLYPAVVWVSSGWFGPNLCQGPLQQFISMGNQDPISRNAGRQFDLQRWMYPF